MPEKRQNVASASFSCDICELRRFPVVTPNHSSFFKTEAAFFCLYLSFIRLFQQTVTESKHRASQQTPPSPFPRRLVPQPARHKYLDKHQKLGALTSLQIALLNRYERVKSQQTLTELNQINVVFSHMLSDTRLATNR